MKLRHKSDVATVGEESRDPSQTSQQARVENTPPPALTRTSGRGFPETQLGGAQRTTVRAAPDAPEEPAPSPACTHRQTSTHTRAHAYMHSSATEEEEQPTRSNMLTSFAVRSGSNASFGSV